MYEVEVKVRADHESVRERLDELDARPLGRVVQVDTYYDAPHREFAETDEALRVRRQREDDATEEVMTYKGPLVEEESKTRREVETTVEDGDATHDVLDALGFDSAATVRKDRERYELDGFTVALDSVEGLGEFVEVETGATDDDIEAAREGVYDLLRTLGLDPEAGIRTSYLGLLLGNDHE